MVLNLTGGHFDQNPYSYHQKSDTMNYLGTLSPPSSSGDSMDSSMTSPMSAQLSPPTLMYNIDQCTIMEDLAIVDTMPFLNIVEQPIEKFRFRYKSEMSGTHGSLIGISSDKMRKSTYPTVQLHNYSGPAIIRCGLYQINNKEPHPHRLVVRIDNKDREKDDPHDIEVSDESNHKAIFSGMGIIHTAKKNLVSELYNKKKFYYTEELARKNQNRALSKREEADLRSQAEKESKSVNLNTVRLGFEAFRVVNNVYIPLCPRVYSHGINNLKSALTGELKIVRMDHTTTSCVGGQEIFILVEKVVKNNIKIRFFECDDDDNEVWHDYGKFSHIDVHHQYAIVFKAPAYRDLNIESTVDVCIELVRPSDGARSEPRIFKYKPCEKIGRKRQRYNESLSSAELPTTINNIPSFGSSSSSLSALGIDSTFFSKADNVNSDEFNVLFKELVTEYGPLCTIDSFDESVLMKDGPTSKPSVSNESAYDSETVGLARRVVSELSALLKRTRDSKDTEYVETVVKKLFYDYKTAEGNNALHTSIMCEQFKELQYILVLLSKMKHLNILDLSNNENETALHISVNMNYCCTTVVTLLLSVGANPRCVNSKGNTPLHCAIELNKLETCLDLITKDTVNIQNDDGYTPLHLAVLKKNLNYVKYLIPNIENVNSIHPSTGNTCLHTAIQVQAADIVSYLLNNTDARIDEENFNKLTPVYQAKLLAKENNDKDSLTTYKILTDYIKEKGYPDTVVKSEPEDEDDTSDDELNIKSEPSSPFSEHMDVEEASADYLPFSSELIEKLAKILDNTPVLKQLSSDLGSPFGGINITTKLLFNYANFSEIPIMRIRNLLLTYGKEEPVQIINDYLSEYRQ